jgi:hypothetical protein
MPIPSVDSPRCVEEARAVLGEGGGELQGADGFNEDGENGGANGPR